MSRTTKALLLAGVITASLPAFAFRGGMGDGFEGGMKHDPMRRFEHMSLMLDLTDEQIAQVKPIIQKQMEDRSESRSKGEGRKGIMKELKAAIEEGASQTEITAIADKAANQTRDRILKRAETMMAIHKVLTPEQKEKLNKFQAMKHKRMSRNMSH